LYEKEGERGRRDERGTYDVEDLVQDELDEEEDIEDEVS
jgi:hypothetical protein